MSNSFCESEIKRWPAVEKIVVVELVPALPAPYPFYSLFDLPSHSIPSTILLSAIPYSPKTPYPLYPAHLLPPTYLISYSHTQATHSIPSTRHTPTISTHATILHLLNALHLLYQPYLWSALPVLPTPYTVCFLLYISSTLITPAHPNQPTRPIVVVNWRQGEIVFAVLTKDVSNSIILVYVRSTVTSHPASRNKFHLRHFLPMSEADIHETARKTNFCQFVTLLVRAYYK